MFEQNSSNDKMCSHCDLTTDKLLRCAGGCGGNVQYCSSECQHAHWKKGHKRSCWKVGKVNTFTMPHPDSSRPRPDVPLRAVHKLDAFGKSGLQLFYSNHLGEEATKPSVLDYFGEEDDEMGWNANGLEEMMWVIVTRPVHDVQDRARLKMGEACFNISKSSQEVEALLRSGIIKETGKTLQIGMYPVRHPICRINLRIDEDSDN
mmetsp:Transcript_47397/g.55375  ORF Transcript_47397/g.55375 Transcript_47397/m.55375 type:complete len:205 (+) Transcript_47397:71-685(+)